MFVKVEKLAHNVESAVFMWEEDDKKSPKDEDGNHIRRFKRVESHKVGDVFHVEDEAGHVLLSTYKNVLKVIGYGDELPKAAKEAPEEVVVKPSSSKRRPAAAVAVDKMDEVAE